MRSGKRSATRSATCGGILLSILGGCAVSKPVTTASPATVLPIHRLAVLPFSGTGGSALAHELIRQMLPLGLTISENPKEADVLLSGSMTDYKPNNKRMIFLGQSTTVSVSGQTIAVSNPVASLSGNQTAPVDAGFGLNGSRVVWVSATVGAVVRLTDRRSGNVLWAGEYAYESLDLDSASKAVAEVLLHSLQSMLQTPPAVPLAASS